MKRKNGNVCKRRKRNVGEKKKKGSDGRKRRGGDEKSHGLGAAYRLAPTSLLPPRLSQHGVLILSNWRSCFGL